MKIFNKEIEKDYSIIAVQICTVWRIDGVWTMHMVMAT